MRDPCSKKNLKFFNLYSLNMRAQANGDGCQMAVFGEEVWKQIEEWTNEVIEEN